MLLACLRVPAGARGGDDAAARRETLRMFGIRRSDWPTRPRSEDGSGSNLTKLRCTIPTSWPSCPAPGLAALKTNTRADAIELFPPVSVADLEQLYHANGCVPAMIAARRVIILPI